MSHAVSGRPFASGFALSALMVICWPVPVLAQVNTVVDRGDACYSTKQFPIARYGEIVLDRPQSILGETSEFGNAEPMGNFGSEDALRAFASPVGRLDIVTSDGCMVTCTATLLADGLIITARHCLRPGALAVVKAHVVFDHYTALDSAKPIFEVNIASVRTFENINDANNISTNPDIAVAKLVSVPDRPTATLYPNLPADSTSLSIIHHPHGAPKYITRGFCRVVANNGVIMTHVCDTEGGSSGGPMVDQTTGQIIGIHTNGKTGSSSINANRGFAIGAIAPQLRAAYGEKFFATPRQAIEVVTKARDLVQSIAEAPLEAPSTLEITLANAISKYDAGQYAEAISPLQILAEKGNATAHLYLGEIYSKGLGVTRSEVQAISFYRKAATAGDALGKLRLGNAYMNGLGVPQDTTSAIMWYGRAADGGNADAKYNLAVMYLSGTGVSRDTKVGLDLMKEAAAADQRDAVIYLAYNLPISGNTEDGVTTLRRAVEFGDSNAMVRLGRLYLSGAEAITKDVPAALSLFQKGADLGNRDAIHRLALMYRDGLGVQRDQLLAEKLLREALAIPESKSRSEDMVFMLGDEIRTDLAELADRNGSADREDVFKLYDEAFVNILPYPRGRAALGLARLFANGDGTEINMFQSLVYSVWGVDATLGKSDNADLNAAWTVFKRAKNSMSPDRERGVLEYLCQSDFHYNGVSRLLVECGDGAPRWKEIAHSVSLPKL